MTVPRKHRPLADDPLWYKDAIIYQLHVKSFFDSDDDGVGDFQGLLEKLDYIANLGVTAVWLLPFYPSPRRDDGYDIADYRNIHPEYGRMAEFKRFVDAAHARGIRVITELVINHTSDMHPWFQRARAAKPGSAARNFYVWSVTDSKYAGTRIIFLDTEKSNWTWDPVAGAFFWHRFYSHQPDLNFDNPRVMKEVLSIMNFWLDVGVDGLRLDAVPYLIEREGTNNENLPETHEILKRIRKELDASYSSRLLLAEANQWPEDTQDYFGRGDECHMAFHFPLMPRMYMAIAQEDRFPITDIMRQTPDIPASCQWAIFLRNHDELTLEMVTDRERDYLWETYAADRRARINLGIRRRLAPLMERDRRRIELMNWLLLTMPGTPVLYYGDEIGMGDNIYLGDRDTVRTPMQWSSDRNGGFSRADPAALTLPTIMDPVYGYQAINVEAQQKDPHSLLNWTRRVLAVRKRHAAFGRGSIRFIRPANRKILCYLREHEGETILCVANVARTAQAVELNLQEFAGRVPRELSGGTAFPTIGQWPYLLTLPPYGFQSFELCDITEAPAWSVATEGVDPEHHTFVVRGGLNEVVTPPSRAHLERDVLPDYVKERRWFQSKDAELKNVQIVYSSADWRGGRELLLGEIEAITDRGSERYVLPLGAAWEDDPNAPFAPQLALARVRRGARVGLLTDAFAVPSFAHAIIKAMGAGDAIDLAEHGEIRFKPTPAFADANPDTDAAVEWLTAEQTNSTLIVGRQVVLKLLRGVAAGVHPEAEMGRMLTTRGFDAIAPMLGEMVRIDAEGESSTLAIVQGFVINQGNAWDWTLSYLERTADELAAGAERADADLFEAYAVLIGTLGQRLGEMHDVLAQPSDDPDFAPETMDRNDVRHVRDAVRGELEKALVALERANGGADDESQLLLEMKADLLGVIDERAAALIGATRTRIHGDFHLGQVLVAGSDVYIIDFEGEPAKPMAQRRAKAHPLRDVAGIIRSLDYAAAMMFAHRRGPEGLLAPERAATLAESFRLTARAAFIEGYEKGRGGPIDAALLDLFLLEKAAYEISYEAANRPGWLDVPTHGLYRIANRLLSREDM